MATSAGISARTRGSFRDNSRHFLARGGPEILKRQKDAAVWSVPAEQLKPAISTWENARAFRAVLRFVDDGLRAIERGAGNWLGDA